MVGAARSSSVQFASINVVQKHFTIIALSVQLSLKQKRCRCRVGIDPKSEKHALTSRLGIGADFGFEISEAKFNLTVTADR